MINGDVTQLEDILKDNFNWDTVFNGFSSLIKDNTKPGIAELIESNFSTSNKILKAVS